MASGWLRVVVVVVVVVFLAPKVSEKPNPALVALGKRVVGVVGNAGVVLVAPRPVLRRTFLSGWGRVVLMWSPMRKTTFLLFEPELLFFAAG